MEKIINPEILQFVNLNLGCGDFPMTGYLNVDVRPEAKCNLVLDLNDLSALATLPEAHYENIKMYHVLEHLDDPFGTVKTSARLLKPGGILHIRVPHASRGFTHAEHKHGFDVGFPYYFDQRLKSFFYGTHLDLLLLRLDWAIRLDLYSMVLPKWQVWILKAMNFVITPIANISPGFCSRIWCYWVGGFEQIEYVFRRPGL